MHRAATLTAASVAVTLYAFVPTGIIALALSMIALSRATRGEVDNRTRQAAMKWLLITLFLGAAVEAPVLAAALIH